MTAIAAAALTIPVAWAALTRTLREPPGIRGRPRDSPIQAFKNADMPARVEVVCAGLSFGLAILSAAFIAMHFGKASTSELTCAYIAGGIFEIVGILVTVNGLIEGGGLTWSPKGWAKWRGPAFLIGGVLLGLLATIAWLHMPQSPR